MRESLTYSELNEPPEGSIVRAAGVLYYNDGDDYAPANWSSQFGEHETWRKVAGNYGPVTVVRRGYGES